ncbi:uncharacterized protein LOC134659221 [Cydia amplana]|uniref:uncharacterized protein LOC134659221 n=1 Tax=Cydia amplana TaxID=1869771 RepID=UPI002FE69231
MEGLFDQRMSPIIKCVVLFLFIFTARALTSRPQEPQENKNSIQQVKPHHYVRTFTKYHHRRTIQWNNNNNMQDYWPTHDQPKLVAKRSVPNLKVVDGNWPVVRKRIRKRSVSIPSLNEFAPDSNSASIIGDHNAISPGSPAKLEKSSRNGLSNDVKKVKDKMESPTTISPMVCLYKANSIARSTTTYNDEKGAQMTVENDFDSDIRGEITNATLNGEAVQLEQCTDPRAICYTLWRYDKAGNITVLGQGCWKASESKVDYCARRNTRDINATFCSCSKSYCNADFTSIPEEVVTPRAESTVRTASLQTNYSNAIASAMLAIVAILVMVVVLRKFYCKRQDLDKDLSDGKQEKGGIMGTGPDALATGLSCVDNLTLIEHIGQGKFGSVWRGSLGTSPVAVKLYSSASAWQKEAAIYALPHMSHPNILKYYGSDSRPALEGGPRSQLIVVELCESTLRARLEEAPLTWIEFATLAHGLSSALAHLHTSTPSKPCIVHRDVNSSNVLVCNGQARLADLGLAQVLHRNKRANASALTEAGTLRYLAPEALDGALDLDGAGWALCAVDVYALGLVLWEMLWRCSGAHPGPTPPHAVPYHAMRPHRASMQTLVSRNKARPPLPKGPVPEARALKIASDTCDECWDHDAEARLTAVCVEERMAELKAMLQTQGPVIHDNNLHPHHPGDPSNPAPEADKNSNCTSTQTCDVTTPLLYPHPHIGRNACIERNTHTNTHDTHTLIHKSLKDITVPADPPRVNSEQCLSVARPSHRQILDYENSDRLNEIRSYQRPLDYVPNDVSSHDDRGPKQTNLLQEVKVEKPKWGIRKFFEKKLNRSKVETEVKLVPETTMTQNRIKTSIVNEKPSNIFRPSNLVINQDRSPFNFEGPCTLSPPNRTLSPTMMIESEMRNENNVFGFKELPTNETDQPNQVFAVIVPKSKPNFTNLIELKKRGSSESINKNSVRTSMSSQSIFKSGNSESEDSTVKKRLSCDNRIITNSNSASSSRASINLELQYIDNPTPNFTGNTSPFDLNSDCSSSEDEHLMLLSENGGSKITMQTIKPEEKKKYQNEVLKEASHTKTDFSFNKFQNKYTNFDNEFSDPNDKENLVNGYSGDNPVYLAALNGEIDTTDLKYVEEKPKSPKPSLKNLTIKRQHSLEQVSEIFSSSGDIHLQNPAGRVKTPGDLPVAVRRARRDRALQKGRANECNRLSLYDDRMMFGNSL